MTTVCAHAHVELVDMELQPVILYYKIPVNLVLSFVALTMQILKPAGFVETAHYPLLLLV